jgi:hypothetical protein
VGDLDSSLTRVQPVVDALLEESLDGEPWLGELWDMAALTRPGAALPRPSVIGKLVAAETPVDSSARLGTVYQRTIAPPAAFLRWLLEHPERMQARDRVTFGAKSPSAQEWRGKLFSGDEALVGVAQAEGLNQLSKRLGQRGRNKWWAFEGFTHVDCCLITEECVLFIEANHGERALPSTRWFEERSQLWRNVEAASEFAGGREFAVILAVESEAEGTAALAASAASLAGSYPHLDAGQREDLARHLIGFVTWAEVATRFALSPECVPAMVSEDDPRSNF